VRACPVKYSMSPLRMWLPLCLAVAGAWHVTATGQTPPQSPAAPPCVIEGIVTSGGTPLPGVALAAMTAGATRASSTDQDGAFRVRASAGSTVTLRAELMGFTPVERAVNVAAQPPCGSRVDLEMALAPRSLASGAVSPPGRGRAAGPGRGQANRFASLALEPDAAAQTAEPPDDPDDVEAVRQLLPPGFSTDAATEAVTLTGSQGQIDRGMLNERMGAIMRGELDGLEPGARPGRGGQGGPPDALADQVGRFGPGERGLGGRMGGAARLQGSLTYTIGGSPLNASPFALRGEEREEEDYLSQRFGATLGGPVKIPGVYDGTRRTSFNFSYSGNRSDEIFDSYSTVPSDALRRGDFSSLLASGIVVRDPETGEPFPGNQIPESRIAPAAASLLRFIPLPNLEGESRNFRYTTPEAAVTDNVSLRLTHNFTPPPAARGRGAGRAAGQPAGPGQGAGRGGRGGRGAQGTSVVLNASVSYRRNQGDRFTAFPTVSGATRGSTLSVPLGLNVRAGRMVHTLRASFGRTTSRASNTFAFVEDVAGAAGIRGIATDPFDWGVPSLSFSTFSALRDIAPSRRDDRRLDLGYTWMLPQGRHTFRAGADYHQDWSSSQTDSNPRGTFVFTGFHAGGPGTRRGSALDFADFLLGLPQQASVQFGPGAIDLRGRSFSLFAQDDWRVSNTVTINAGLRYEFVAPFEEAGGRMVNLDVAGDFSAAVPVQSGQTGPFSGAFPFALVRSDRNNLAPRIGAAWRISRGNVLRAGYGINYNAGSYATIARQLIAQPPFAVTNTSIGTAAAPLSLADPFARVLPSTTTNNYGIDPDYELGIAQVWNADYGRDLPWALNAGISYNGTRGTHLDMLRAPNRDATGVRIEGVQPFIWQASEGRSTLHAVSLRLRKRMTRGIGGGAGYTWTRARDNASSFGGAGGAVAQDDRNLEAEWGRSSFERAHRVTADATFELPFGRNRRWLSEGGALAALAGDWTLSANYSYESGQPYTARVLGAASEIARGTNGSLRADYAGGDIQLANPTIDQFFNVAAFRIPGPGQFGTAPRNSIIGPPAHQLNAALARDVRFGRTRALTVRVNASNVLNTPVWGAIDTVVNSPTFGQVLSVRSMRTVGVNVRFRF